MDLERARAVLTPTLASYLISGAAGQDKRAMRYRESLEGGQTLWHSMLSHPLEYRIPYGSTWASVLPLFLI